MRIKSKSGSRERLFEMFQGVNKKDINELNTITGEWGKIIDSLKKNVSDIKIVQTGLNKTNKGKKITFNDGSEVLIDPVGMSLERVYVVKSEYQDSLANWFKRLHKDGNISFEELWKIFSEKEINEWYDDEYYSGPSKIQPFNPNDFKKVKELHTLLLIDKIPDIYEVYPDWIVNSLKDNGYIEEVEFTWGFTEEGENKFPNPESLQKFLKNEYNRETPLDDRDPETKMFSAMQGGVEENIVDKKEDSDPYGDSSQKFQKPIDYVDKKPVNNNLRTRSRELNKYVRESTDQDKFEEVVFMQGDEASEPLNVLMNQGPEQALEYLKQWHSPGSHEGTDELKHGSSDFTHEQDGYTMSWNPYVGYIGLVYDLSELNESEEGEKMLKSKSNLLNADLDFSRMADAYKGLLNIKHGEFKNTDVLQQTLSDLSNTLAKYLKNVKGIDVDQEDVQRFFDKQTQPVDTVVENEDSEEEAPALDPEDVDNDGDKLEGGLADDSAVMEFDPQELLKGIEVEMEHTKDPRIAIELAMDHLYELDDYYTRLEQMEEKGREETPSIENNDESSIDVDNIPDELKQHGEVLNDTSSEDEELKDAILGYSTQTPNKMGEEKDFASEYLDNDKYKRYQELDSKDFDSLSDEEEEEFFELWKEFN